MMHLPLLKWLYFAWRSCRRLSDEENTCSSPPRPRQYLPSLSFLVIKQMTTVKSLTTHSSNHAPWYLPKEVENFCPHKNLYVDVCRNFVHICQTWKKPKCPAVGKWINKWWYIQTTDYYSALKRNEVSSHEKTWRHLKCILLSERSQSEKATSCMIPIIWHSGKGKTMETIKRSLFARCHGLMSRGC